ncbi:MAG: type IV pilin protein, partial [Limisphaerales bacterium]
GTQTRRDPKAVDRTMQYLNDLPAGWKSSSETDLVSIANELLHPRNKPVNATPDVTDGKDAARLILQKFEKYSPVVEELRNASQRPYARFNIAYDSPDKIAILLPHLAMLRGMCRLLMMRATAELALEQPEQAFADVELAIYLAETIRIEPIVISQLVRQASLNLALQPLMIGLRDHRWSAAQLQKLQGQLDDADLIAGMKLSLDGESKFFINSGLDDLKAHHNRLKLIRQWQSLMSAHSTEESNNPLADFLFFLAVPRGWIDFEQLNYQQTFVDGVQKGIDLSQHSIDPKAATDTDQLIQNMKARGPFDNVVHHHVVATMTLPSFDRIAQKTAVIQAQVNMARVACALERYRLANGLYPDDVAALSPRFIAAIPNDPIKGGELKYRRTGDAFLLYSIGWNATDDGGKTVMTTGKNPHADAKEGDWVWGAAFSF